MKWHYFGRISYPGIRIKERLWNILLKVVCITWNDSEYMLFFVGYISIEYILGFTQKLFGKYLNQYFCI